MKFIVDRIESLYDGFFKLFKVNLSFEKYNGEFNSASIEVLDRGDSAAVLLYQKDTKELLLVEQFRYATTKSSNGWIMELVAGRIEEKEKPEESITREIAEEIGYEITNLKNIGQYYLSPGGTTERIYIFYSEVNSENRVELGGGKIEESEDIKLIKIKVDEIEGIIKRNVIIDAKTIIAIQWFLKNKLNIIT